ncbi:MAG: hypothetical protein JWO38_6180 [Gemmataceae bacterium]|nr:hypothetical protein [Gemmataceae bacterium]
MPEPKSPPEQLPEKDWLLTRLDDAPLPTPLDPAGPAARGYPADPKPVPKRGQGDPRETNPAPDDIGRSA